MEIPWDLEETSLSIKTDASEGSNEKIEVLMTVKDNITSVVIAGLWVKFSSPMQYAIALCTSDFTDLPVQPPLGLDKIWTIAKTETDMTLWYDNVELLRFVNH